MINFVSSLEIDEPYISNQGLVIDLSNQYPHNHDALFFGAMVYKLPHIVAFTIYLPIA
ncbi:MAG: hypothetical protein WCI71_19165 [Bacteroidota bacterium]